jgi:crotonobetainyl-CoA:carnitine CoA-transferase CaiB-like acyl-CoA transferase
LSERPGPLSDVRVVEFAQVMAIPTCGLLLADLGADVVKVEPPLGDSFRRQQRAPGKSADEGRGYAIFNRGKRSLCLDLTHPQSASVVQRLVSTADVALVSFKPSDLPRYGLSYAQLRVHNPELIYLENTPYGPDGPLGEDGGYDVVVQGISGIGAITAAPAGDAPRFVRPAYADMGTGFLAALGVVTALRHRDRTGRGQRVQTSLLSTAITLGANVLHEFEEVDAELRVRFEAALSQLRETGEGFADQQALYFRMLHGAGHGNVYFRHYRTRDGFLSVGCLSPGLNARFLRATGLEDPRARDDFDPSSEKGWDELTGFVRESEDLFRTRSTEAWMVHLRAHGVPCGPFNFPTQIFDDEQIRANRYLVELEHHELGRYRTFAPPIRLEESPARVEGSAPPLGAHTDALLAELGFSAREIAALRDAGAVGRARRRGSAV